MNPQNVRRWTLFTAACAESDVVQGLRIHAFRNAPLNQDDDTLLRLSEYLELIARLPSFDQLDHDDWKLYVRRHRARQGGNRE